MFTFNLPGLRIFFCIELLQSATSVETLKKIFPERGTKKSGSLINVTVKCRTGSTYNSEKIPYNVGQVNYPADILDLINLI